MPRGGNRGREGHDQSSRSGHRRPSDHNDTTASQQNHNLRGQGGRGRGSRAGRGRGRGGPTRGAHNDPNRWDPTWDRQNDTYNLERLVLETAVTATTSTPAEIPARQLGRLVGHSKFRATPGSISSSTFLVSGKRNFAEDFCTMLVDGNRGNDDISRPSRNSKDPVLEVVVLLVEARNHGSFLHWYADMRVGSATAFVSTFDETDRESTTKMVTFIEPGHVGCTVPVKLVRAIVTIGKEEHSLTKAMVRTHGEWTNLEAWLDSRPPSVAKGDLVGKRGYDKQWEWWQANGKVFNFLSLPGEIRNTIYESDMPPAVYPGRLQAMEGYAETRGCCTYGTNLGIGFKAVWPWESSMEAPNLSFFMLNKQIYEEAFDKSWKCSPKHFKFAENFQFMMEKKLLENLPIDGALKVLSLQFDHMEYIRFFGIDIQPFGDHKGVLARNYCAKDGHETPGGVAVTYGEWGLAKYVRDNSRIEVIELNFTPPARGGAADPWAWLAYEERLDDYLTYSHYAPTSCQKILVDWILSFAKEYIEHIPTIKLTGAIKWSTKAKWDEIFGDERKGKKHTVDLQALRNMTPDQLPPACHCTNKCGWRLSQTVDSEQQHRAYCRRGYPCWCVARRNGYYGPEDVAAVMVKDGYEFDQDD